MTSVLATGLNVLQLRSEMFEKPKWISNANKCLKDCLNYNVRLANPFLVKSASAYMEMKQIMYLSDSSFTTFH